MAVHDNVELAARSYNVASTGSTPWIFDGVALDRAFEGRGRVV
jgi:hypothetical protein